MYLHTIYVMFTLLKFTESELGAMCATVIPATREVVEEGRPRSVRNRNTR